MPRDEGMEVGNIGTRDPKQKWDSSFLVTQDSSLDEHILMF